MLTIAKQRSNHEGSINVKSSFLKMASIFGTIRLMPITKSALKKVRSDRRRTSANDKMRLLFKRAVKQVKTKPSAKLLQSAYSAVDRAAKKRLIHRNKAARLKSALARLVR